MLSVVVSPEFHQTLTNLWRENISYGTGTREATAEMIYNIAGEIYKTYPAIMESLGL